MISIKRQKAKKIPKSILAVVLLRCDNGRCQKICEELGCDDDKCDNEAVGAAAMMSFQAGINQSMNETNQRGRKDLSLISRRRQE